MEITVPKQYFLRKNNGKPEYHRENIFAAYYKALNALCTDLALWRYDQKMTIKSATQEELMFSTDLKMQNEALKQTIRMLYKDNQLVRAENNHLREYLQEYMENDKY